MVAFDGSERVTRKVSGAFVQQVVEQSHRDVRGSPARGEGERSAASHVVEAGRCGSRGRGPTHGDRHAGGAVQRRLEDQLAGRLGRGAVGDPDLGEGRANQVVVLDRAGSRDRTPVDSRVHRLAEGESQELVPLGNRVVEKGHGDLSPVHGRADDQGAAGLDVVLAGPCRAGRGGPLYGERPIAAPFEHDREVQFAFLLGSGGIGDQDAGRTVVVDDRAGCRFLAARNGGVGGIAQGHGDGFVALLDLVVSHRDVQGPRRLAGHEGQGAGGLGVVAAGAGRRRAGRSRPPDRHR